MKVIFSGLESSGKSLQLAMFAEKVLIRNVKWRLKTGKARSIYTNSPFSKTFQERAAKWEIPIVIWNDLDELIQSRDCDVFIDEIGTYFDARSWSDLSIDVRRWIQQGAKMGIELYGAAQDFAQVDISFRRLTSQLFYINKIAGSRRPSPTKPPVKWIWGLCHKIECDPQTYLEDKNRFQYSSILNWLSGWFRIRREYCELFDTSYFLKPSKPTLLKHIERYCENSDCVDRYGKPFKKVIHT